MLGLLVCSTTPDWSAYFIMPIFSRIVVLLSGTVVVEFLVYFEDFNGSLLSNDS